MFSVFAFISSFYSRIVTHLYMDYVIKLDFWREWLKHMKLMSKLWTKLIILLIIILILQLILIIY